MNALKDASKATLDILSKAGFFRNTMQKIDLNSVDRVRDVREYSYVADLADKVFPDSTYTIIDQQAFEDTIFDNKTPSIFFLVHHDPISWMPAVPLCAKYFMKVIQERNVSMYPFVFYHKIVQNFPLAKQVSANFTGNSVSTYAEMMELLNQDKPYFFATCPEGSNCLFHFDEPVAPFQQFALIKAALASKANVAVISTQHDNPLSVRVKFPMIGKLKKGANAFRLPFMWMTKNRIDIVFEKLEKPISHGEFNSLPREEQNRIISEFADTIRHTMIERSEEIAQGKYPIK